MIRFFRGSGIAPMTLLMLVSLALWIEHFISLPLLADITGGAPMPLWGVTAGAFSAMPLLAVVLSYALMLVVALVMVRFNIAIFFIPRRTYLPALLYVILYSLFPGEMVLNPALPAALLVMIGLWRMISAYRANGLASNFFDAALLISAGSMFYAGAVWFILLVFIGALILRSPDLREITFALAGALLPWLLLYAVWYVTGGSVADLTETVRHNLFDERLSVYISRTMVILLAATGLNFLPAIVSLAGEMPTQKIRSRKTFEMLLWMTFICLAAYIFVPSVSVEMNAMTAIPVAFIIARYLTFTRNIVSAEILFWLMAIMIVVSRVWPF
jgi:hypothetical protein